jgi:hypothetical protein
VEEAVAAFRAVLEEAASQWHDIAQQVWLNAPLAVA